MIIVWIILIVWGLWLLWPRISHWLMRKAQAKMQDHIFRSMGIDPEQMRRGQTASQGRHTSRSHSSTSHRHSKIIPPEYGEYVEFTILSITGTEAWLDTSDSPVYRQYNKEVQISDAKYTIVK